jgi:hypothetical protein
VPAVHNVLLIMAARAGAPLPPPQRYAHITNYSINKHSSKFVENVDESCASSGSKWSMQAFRRYLREVRGVDDGKVWASIKVRGELSRARARVAAVAWRCPTPSW